MKFNTFLLIILVSLGGFPHEAFPEETPKPTADGDALIEAIATNDEAKVTELLSKKVDPNSRGHKNLIGDVGKLRKLIGDVGK